MNAYLDYPISSLYHLLAKAKDLHLVNSSIYCFSVIIELNTPGQNLYMYKLDKLRARCQTTLNWREYALFDSKGEKLEIPLEEKRQEIYSTYVENSSRLVNRSLNLIIFGPYKSPWNPEILSLIQTSSAMENQ